MNTALVYIWDTLAGAAAWDELSGVGSFEYEPSFRNNGWDIAPLMMPLSQTGSIFSFPENRKRKDDDFNTFKGLPGLLSDALPDRYGSTLINAWLTRQGREADSMNPVELLCFIGSRGMGALEFRPPVLKEPRRAEMIEIESLVYIAKKILSAKKSFRTGFTAKEEQGLRDILRIGTSAGGARPKAVIAYNEKTGEVRSGQTNAPSGFEHWLIKLDGVSSVQLGKSTGYGRIEMAYHLMALDCGIGMMPCRLLEENGRAHFITKRFDRHGSRGKHHIQTFCALNHFDYNNVTGFSYEQLFQTMRRLQLPYPDAEQMFRRMVFNVMARNCDDHTKNFSFRMKKDGKWELAPAYDLCHAYQPGHRWVSQHALSINGKRDEITRGDLLTVAKSINCKNATEIIEQIRETVNRWDVYARSVGVSVTLRKSIDKTLIKSI